MVYSLVLLKYAESNWFSRGAPVQHTARLHLYGQDMAIIHTVLSAYRVGLGTDILLLVQHNLLNICGVVVVGGGGGASALYVKRS